MDINYTKSGKVFNQHQYWTKQPLEAIDYFILKYSNEGDYVLDPFCGTGMTGVSGSRLNRNVILSDISKICQHISKGYTSFYNIDETKFSNALNQVTQNLEEYYITQCPICQKNGKILFSIIEEVYSDEFGISLKQGESLFRKIKQDEPIKTPRGKNIVFNGFELIQLAYKCECSSTKLYKKPNRDDLVKFKTKNFIDSVLPNDYFFGKEPVRNFKKGIKKVKDLYSNRNLTVLSHLKYRIDLIENEEIKTLFKFAFTSVLFNCSLMSRYRKYENTSIKMGTFYIPPVIKDNNVLKSFCAKVNSIRKSNIELYSERPLGTVNISGESASNLKTIDTNSIDYIYTDPPYGDILSYSELNLVWESWLKELSDNENEMIISKEVGKTENHYFELFEKFLAEASRVLKKDKILTIIFHHPNIDYWKRLQSILLNSNFTPIIEELPTRLVSGNKTSSQHVTKKNTQSFLAFSFINKKQNQFEVLELIEEEKLVEFKEVLSSLKMKGSHYQYDVLINNLLPNY